MILSEVEFGPQHPLTLNRPHIVGRLVEPTGTDPHTQLAPPGSRKFREHPSVPLPSERVWAFDSMTCQVLD